ncbi:MULTISPECIES: YwdI family protein [Sediminibacillus]|uniref:YwdI family protein n=1 Tax=Sediminibacillus TaxID=482460 RepID=UPI001294ACF5|nr:YwdI family protein [Sediminibacillus terrae]
MAISNQSVLTKMMSELQEALANNDQTAAVREHVRAVRMLCDLMLEEGNAEAGPEQELAKMMGGMHTGKTGSSGIQSAGKQTADHGEANGNSIFDF